MQERGPSIAESLIDAGALLDARYRLDGLVRRSATATIHLATHRNGSTAWLKLPISAAYAAGIGFEAGLANALGAPLIVRDDGTTPDGVPYLVLDPPDAESVARLRARSRKEPRLPLARIMTAGDALARVVASVHAMGYVTAGLEDEDVLVFANGDVALLDLDALVPATPAGIAGDARHVVRLLSALIADVADAPSAQAVASIRGVLAASYPDVVALQAAWRAGAAEPIAMPSRIRSGSFADIPSSPRGSLETPLSVSLEPLRESEGSMIGYLRSGGVPSIPPPVSAPRAVMSDPLSNLTAMPRLIQATSHRASPEAPSSRMRMLVGGSVAASVALVASALFLLWPASPSVHRASAVAALEAKAPPASPAPLAPSPPTAPAPVALPAPPEEDLETNTRLRTDRAPPGRDVFIDEAVVGKTPLDVSVPCGRHVLQMVAGAPKQVVELPCGGERVVRYDTKGRWSLK
jgi:hypothetical protein